ncbi:hypothetical protein JCM11641_001644 [Rhodosporidiobolus odoratus]
MSSGSTGSHARGRSSADLYASVPTQDSTNSYPPIRTITPRSPAVPHSPDEHDGGDHESLVGEVYSSTPPFFSQDRRSPSMNTFASEYDASSSDAYRLRGGAGTPATFGTPGLGGYEPSEGHDYSQYGSSANLNSMAYRNVPGAGRNDSYAYGKEGASPERSPPASTGGVGGKGTGWWGRKSSRAKTLIILALLLLVIIIAVAVAVPVAISKSKNNEGDDNDGTEKGIPTGANPAADPKSAAYGGNGTEIFLEDGSSFTYNNSFGGYWVSIPFNDTARAQRDVPRLNETWDYEKNLVQGVNIGGWLVLEPFIVPHMFEPFNSESNSPNETSQNNAIDEWTLSEALTAQNNLSSALVEHYETFITEKDFAQIASAGLNWVRIPIGWWAIETWDGEPFLQGVAWQYFLKAIGWARKYGLRINLDLHAVPGSQNGYNHSGRQGSINFLNGLMGIANAQRTLDYIRTLTEFISQPEYKNVVPMFSVLNEPYAATIGSDALRHFYIETYEMMRSISGTGESNGPFITFHDGFVTLSTNVTSGGWNGFLNGWDRVALDSHRYLCFDTPNNYGLAYQASLPCNYWAQHMNQSTNQFGVTMGGEWSLAINDCGKWLNNVGNGARYDGTYYVPGNTTAPAFEAVGNCDEWNDWSNWNATIKDGLRLVAEGHMDALRHWFFWTWKTGFSTTIGTIANPMWNYQLGLEQGWIPTNPRTALGACPSLVTSNGFTIGYTAEAAPTLAPWMTGGSGAGTFSDQAMYTSFSAWPPESIGAAASTGPYLTAVSNLPTYTQTGSIITMSAAASPTSFPSGYDASVNVGSGWVQSTDTAKFYTTAADCTYVDPWSGAGVANPSTPYCGGETAAATTDADTVAATNDAAAARRMKRYIKSTPQPSPTYWTPTAPPRPASTARMGRW